MSNSDVNSCQNTSLKLLPPITGNIIPHSWYSQIVTEAGKPDHNAIAILSEIVYWYRPREDGSTKFQDHVWQTSYNHFEQKFRYNKQKIRRALVRLEELNLIEREFRTIYKFGQRYNNVLFIHISVNLQKICSSNSFLTPNFDTPSIQRCRDNIRNKDYISKNRSIGSNFIQNSLSDLKIEEVEEDRKLKTNTPLLPSIVLKEQNLSNLPKFNPLFHKSYLGKTKHLQDFYPLSQEECLELKHLSGRDFSLNAMNEILKDVARKKLEWSCGSKKGFMTYMTEVLKFEKRQAVLVSGEGFRIRNNLSAEEINSKAQEKFLADIENSSQTSPELHFKKKLAAVLDPNSAYKLLKSYSSSSREGGIFKIYLTTPVELSSVEKEIILQQAKATHEKLCGKELVLISELEINTHSKPYIQVNKDASIELPSGVWGNMRLKLMKHFGSEGKALDESWFSKLSAEVDEQERVVRLKAPTSFMRDWINNRYGSILEGLCQTEDFKLNAIT